MVCLSLIIREGVGVYDLNQDLTFNTATRVPRTALVLVT